MNKSEKNGSHTGMWLAIGAGVGTAIGVALNNIGMGLSFGTGLGLIIGAVITIRQQSDSQKGS